MDKVKYEPVVNDIVYVRNDAGQITMYKVCKFIAASELYIINRNGYLWEFETFLEHIDGEVVLIMRDRSCVFESKEGEIEFVVPKKEVYGYVRTRNDLQHR